MADLVLTASDVKAGAGAQTDQANAGEAVTAGESIYVGTDGLVYKAIANDTEAKAASRGIAINDAAIGQPVVYVKEGLIDLGSVVSAGAIYAVSPAAAGGIAPVADLSATDWLTILGVGADGDTIRLRLNRTGVQVA